jgi:hypothetical protein
VGTSFLIQVQEDLMNKIAVVGSVGGGKGPESVADLLGLDSYRQTMFKEAYDAVMKKVLTLEAEKAKVSQEGDITRPERERYEKYDRRNKLFIRGIGEYDRTVILTKSGKLMTINDTGVSHDGSGTYSSSSALPHDAALTPYRHLIK